MHRTVLRLGAFAAFLSLVLAQQACVTYGGPSASTMLTDSTPHVPASSMTVRSRNGPIRVLADHALDAVEIETKLTCTGQTQQEADERLAGASLQIVRDSSHHLSIKPVFPGGDRGGDGAQITVRLPDARGIDVTTSNGSVTIEGMSGRVVGRTSNGSIRVTDHDGSVDAETSNGDVTVTDGTGSLDIRTSNGSVEIEQFHGEQVSVSTSNGSVGVILAPEATGPIDIRSSNGSIRVVVGTAFASRVSMETSNSWLMIRDPSGRIASTSLDGSSGSVVIGDDQSSSRIRTSNGRITLEAMP